jgi:hypothetical protein
MNLETSALSVEMKRRSEQTTVGGEFPKEGGKGEIGKESSVIGKYHFIENIYAASLDMRVKAGGSKDVIKASRTMDVCQDIGVIAQPIVVNIEEIVEAHTLDIRLGSSPNCSLKFP